MTLQTVSSDAESGQLTPSGAATRAGMEQFAAVSSIFDAAEMVLYVADMETYELLFMNSQAELLWGKNRAGERCYKVLQAGQSGPCEFCTNARLTENGRPTHPVIWEFQNTANKRWYLCIDKAIPWPDGRQVRMEVAIDVTARKLQEQFREQYVGLISHDLRTPISTIDLSATLLKKLLVERAGLAEAARPVDAILRNTRRMADMIEDLLETTRLESGQLQVHKSPVDLGQLAATVVGQLGTTASRAIRCEASGPAPVLGNAGRIERVLDNLVGNAIRYSPPDSLVRVQIEANETEAIVTVADCGIGIPADELPKLFQRFYRATSNRSANGLGLGLYNSRLIVEQHGGRIWAESSPGAGSTFRFALPLAPLAQSGAPSN
jgi:two-component system phosphate regulon sensor histidine kinase PhoR